MAKRRKKRASAPRTARPTKSDGVKARATKKASRATTTAKAAGRSKPVPTTKPAKLEPSTSVPRPPVAASPEMTGAAP